jgi:hypothetical protein
MIGSGHCVGGNVSPGADVAVAAGARPGSRKRKAGTDEAMRSLAAAADGIPEGFRSGLPWKGRRSLHQFKHYLYSHHEVGNFPRVAPNGRPAARSVRDPLGDGWRLNDTRLFSTLNIGESATGPALHTGHSSSFHAISQNIHSYRELMRNASCIRFFSASPASWAHRSTLARIHSCTWANSGEA